MMFLSDFQGSSFPLSMTASIYDEALHREVGGISFSLKFENPGASVDDGFVGEKPYFTAEINGKMYVVDIE